MPKLDDILQEMILPETGDLRPDLARYLLGIRFSDKRAAEYDLLVEKNQTGKITTVELEELEALVAVNTMLMILKTKARRSIVEQPSAA